MAPMKIARISFVCCNLVYIIGGWNDGGRTNSVEVYNFDTNVWCEGKKFPAIPGWYLYACAVNNKLDEEDRSNIIYIN